VAQGLPKLNTERFLFAPEAASPNSPRGFGEVQMSIKQRINAAYQYLEDHELYQTNLKTLGIKIDKLYDDLDYLRQQEPDSPLIEELEECIAELEFRKGVLESAIDMGLTDGDDGRDPDNNWF
jgi:hypothetical protein